MGDLPTGEQVLARYVEATGGRAAYEKLHTRIASGTMELASMGIKGPFTMWQSEPDRIYAEFDLAGLGKIQTGSNGEVVWEQNPMTGYRLLQSTERAAFLRTASMEAELQWQRFFSKVECAGKETVDGRPTYKVVLTPLDGKPLTSYYDVESGLLAKTDMVLETQMGEVPVETRVSEYKSVEGILIPYVSRQKILMMEQVITLEKVQHNVEVPKDRFALPPEIAALADKAARPSAAPPGTPPGE